ncbi:uncharacterized protein MELLADRAFT_113682 [Melampsora larici-populina 98AG31]|uniref:AAA+ ATPase domain-containing protein n=1 Tax=Melampsora larici-populina (strain 98AG31 / pathotype 3-4-7) TaxID=747676 RepID=F4SAR1_MELLP|nr:uncharacterized protein MELLADRAFT_113682 [Melampsora larici-populina 98AG31]EGF98274.1 hypothetical protein MELLADRAFT_113682 [Melampsora larici-populina 98AG31]
MTIRYSKITPEGVNENNQNLEPEPEWPSRGEICFENVEARYRPELDLVLKGVSFTAKAGEKVGICGRTGAGKLTITLSLFRLIDLSSGRITIDGVNISTLSLSGLRSRIGESGVAKVVVMDEATSAVDGHTDGEVQEVIRECFGKSTLVVISHQINMIMDCNRVIVLGNRKVSENGSPTEVLKD